MSLIEERYLEFTGDNWKDVLSFVDGGEFVTTYSKHEKNSSVEDTSYIYCESLDLNVFKGDFVVWVNDHLEVFSAEDWREYSMPEDVLEFERLVNVLIPSLAQGVDVFDLVEKVTGGSISIEYTGKEVYGVETDNKYSINGTDVALDRSGSGTNRKLKVSLL